MWLWMRAFAYMFIVGAGWLCVLPALLFHLEFGAIEPPTRALPFLLIGIGFFAIGVVLAIWAGCHLIKLGNGTPLPLDRPQRLVTEGPYGIVRNPQAIAMVSMVLGEIWAIDSRWIWLMLPLTLAYLELLVGPHEERQLAKDFGVAYQQYASRTRKWIPRFR